MAFTRTTARELGAALVADDSRTDVEIAKRAGVHKATLERWKKAPEFEARVRDARATSERKALEIALEYGIADARQRMRSLNERWKKMQRVIAERAKDPVMEKAPGGRTGLLVHRRKVIGQGDNGMMVDEYEVDTGLLHELRETERQAAQEMGEWVSKHEDVTITTAATPTGPKRRSRNSWNSTASAGRVNELEVETVPGASSATRNVPPST